MPQNHDFSRKKPKIFHKMNQLLKNFGACSARNYNFFNFSSQKLGFWSKNHLPLWPVIPLCCSSDILHAHRKNILKVLIGHLGVIESSLEIMKILG